MVKKILLTFIISFACLLVFVSCENQSSNPVNNQKAEKVETNSTKDILISMEKTACYGNCPVYTLVILSDGTVVFNSPMYFAKEDTKNIQKSLRPIVSKITETQLKQIIEAIEKADYFSLKDKYKNVTDGGCPTFATDSPTVFTSVQINNKKKSIEHYLGCLTVGTDSKIYPKELTELENKIEEIVNPQQWLK